MRVPSKLRGRGGKKRRRDRSLTQTLPHGVEEKKEFEKRTIAFRNRREGKGKREKGGKKKERIFTLPSPIPNRFSVSR